MSLVISHIISCRLKKCKNEGYDFDRDGLAEVLEEIDKGGAFIDIELYASAIELISSVGVAIGFMCRTAPC